MNFKDKKIIVTGAGGGLGRELAYKLLDRGAIVIAVDRNEAALKETRENATFAKDHLFIYSLDITDKQAIDAFYVDALSKHKTVDGLVNNAGIIQPFKKLALLDDETINRIFNVNFFGTLNLISKFLNHFLTRPEAHIINIASMGGFLPVPGQTIYCASKAAVKLMTEGLEKELSNTFVRVSIVFPGAMNTNIMANSGLDGKPKESVGTSKIKILSASDAATQIVQATERNQKRVFIGTDSKAMNFLYRLSPGFASNLIYKKMKDKLM